MGTYYIMISMIGPHYEMLNAFVLKQGKVLRTPQILMIVAIVFMFIGSGFAVGGLYGEAVTIVYIVLAVTCCILVFFQFIRSNHHYTATFSKMLEEMEDWDVRKKLE